MTARFARFLAITCLMFFGHVAAAQTPGAKIEAEIARIAAASQGTVGVAAIHLPTGRKIELNGSQRFEMASTLKLPVSIYALHLGERGKISLTQALPVRREQMTEPGILFDHFRFPGLALSTLNAVELSVTVSDNGATDVIYSRVGGPRAVNSWLQGLGLSDIDLGTKTVAETFDAPTSSAPASAAADGGRTATPTAMADLLARLQRGQLLDAQRTDTMLDIMERTKGERISLQLPPGTVVRHKTGTLFAAGGLSVNDVGLIEMPGGGTIAIAVFIKDSPETVSHSTRDKVIGGISRAIFDHFLFTK